MGLRVLLSLAFWAGLAAVSNATILGFGQIGGSNTSIPADFGSNASGDADGIVVSNGATPNISLSWDSNWDIHTSSWFSGLENKTVGGGDWDNEGNMPRVAQLDTGYHSISFSATPGYALVLNSFDFGHTAETAGITEWDLTLTDASAEVVWSRSLTMNNADAATSIYTVVPNFTGEMGESYTLTFDRTEQTYSSNGRHALDNLYFSQLAAFSSPLDVTIISPTNGSSVSGMGAISVAAEIANETVNLTASKVEFYVDGQLQGIDEEAPYEAILTDLAIGERWLGAEVYDTDGGIAHADSVVITVLPPDPAAFDPADLVDPFIGVTGAGSTIPGTTLPHGSVFPSPDSRTAVASGYQEGSPVVGFSQLHASGVGSSTLSYGNFLVSPRIGLAIDEDDNGSDMENIEAHPYSFRGRLTDWGIDCAVAPTHNTVIYEFEFPASGDARINFDVSRKLGSSTGMRSGSIQIDLENGVISGGGTFDGNWNPAQYDVYFYGVVDAAPTGGGTWINNTAEEGRLSASVSYREKLGGWMQFDTAAEQTVRLKIAVSFASVAKAQHYLENEIPHWDLNVVEAAAKATWNEALSAVETPGIDWWKARKVYTALYHSMIMPRNRTGDPDGWASDAPFWDDQYTVWDTWQTLYPLLGLLQPDATADIVNSFAERYKRNGVAETAFIMGKDFQVGQGGDEVDRVIADALARDITGIDWDGVWSLMEFNAGRRTTNYRELGYVPTDGDREGYDSRMQSGSSTLGFAHGDWCAAQVAERVGKTEEAEELLERSQNWRNVWNADADGSGFSGFVQGRASNGSFLTTDVTSTAGFYQGTAWNYSFNIQHDREAMIDLMGGHARFIERLNYAFDRNSSTYIDFSNEVNLQATFLFGVAHRPYLSSYWVDSLRSAYGAYGYPGDEDSGAMASLYFFATAGIFPMATEDIYYLHGPRVPELSLHLANDKTFTITAEDSSDDNIYVQSASLNGTILDEAIIHHADITAGGALDFEMGPFPNIWGTDGDFDVPDEDAADQVWNVAGPWNTALGSPALTNENTIAAVWGVGPDNADNSAIYAALDSITLDPVIDSVTLGVTITLSGLRVVDQTADRFAWGLFYQADGNADLTWPGYLASNDATDSNGTGAILRKAAEDTFYSSTAGDTLETYALPYPDFEDGSYRLTLTLTRNERAGLDYYAAITRLSDGVLLAAYTGSDPAPPTLQFNRIGLRAGDGIDADSILITDCTVYTTASTVADSEISLATSFDENGQVVLAWSGVSENADSLTLRYRTQDGLWSILAEGINPAEMSYVISALSAGIRYDFQAIEVDNDGSYLAYSNTDSMTQGIMIEPIDEGLVRLSWTTGNGTHYTLQRTSILTTGSWQAAGTVNGDGSMYSTNIPAEIGLEFYRLQVQ